LLHPWHSRILLTKLFLESTPSICTLDDLTMQDSLCRRTTLRRFDHALVHLDECDQQPVLSHGLIGHDDFKVREKLYAALRLLRR